LPDADQPQLQVRDGVDAEQLIPAAPQRLDVRCPYPGMRREAQIDELIGRLGAGEHEIFVIGPSGSGKSSLVTAGRRLLFQKQGESGIWPKCPTGGAVIGGRCE
jgi:ABC-type protease/lipase transport system fused ATPase/permease subunit